MNFLSFRGIFIASLLVLQFVLSFSQTPPPSKSSIIPPSPTVASLQKYINYPVKLSTGVPEITIPIYTISIKGFSYPISISYHGSGMKVADIASNVGLGWSLSANGMVNISANGLLDDQVPSNTLSPKIKSQTFNFFASGPAVDCTTLGEVMDASIPYRNLLQFYSGTDISFLSDVVKGLNDTEPDLYTFSTATIGGKFFKDENNIFRTIPLSENKIEQIFDNTGAITGYKITDGKGVCYTFGFWQGTLSTTATTSGLATSNSSSQNYGREYYLTKITTPVGGEIDFNYSFNSGYNYNLTTQFSRGLYTTYPGTDYNTAGGGYSFNSSSVTTISTGEPRLTSITANNGTIINFGYETASRTDLPAGADNALASISISNGSSVVKTFTLIHDYFNGSLTSSDYNDYRLRLLSIQESGQQPYLFTYNTAMGIPNRLSLGVDHWGYNNGQGNSTLLPADDYDGFPTGGIRDPDTLAMQAGILTKITYPTGGYAQYTYEANTYWESQSITQHQKITAGGLSSVSNQTVTTTFTVPANSEKLTMYYEDTFDGTNYNVGDCRITLTDPNGNSTQYLGSNMQGLALQNPGTSPTPGTYTISIENTANFYTAADNYTGDVYFTWYQSNVVAPHNAIGGGLRVKQIRAYAADNQAAYIKNFDYNIPGTSQSSGQNFFDPNYITYKDESRYVLSAESGNCSILSLPSVIENSTSNTPLTESDGYSVSYSDVTEYDVDKTQNGYTHSLFNNSLFSNAAQNQSFPNAPLIPYDWVKGELLEKDTYKYSGSNYIMIQKEVNQYNYNNFDQSSTDPNIYKAYGVKIGVLQEPTYCDYCSAGFNPSDPGYTPVNFYLSDVIFAGEYYQYYSSWHYLTQTQTTVFDQNGNNPVVTSSNYYYDNPAHLQLTRTVTTNSKNQVLTSSTTYPDDYAAGTTFLDDMKTAHLITVPIEQANYQDDNTGTKILNGSVTQYQAGGKGLIDKIFKLESSTPIALSSYKFSNASTGQLPYGNTPSAYSFDAHYQPKLTYNQYDNLGNPLMLTPQNGVPVSYQWGYAQQYPIAECKNASNTEFYYEGFEESTASGLQTNGGHTGHNYIVEAYTVNWTPPNSRSYVISYWYRTGGVWTYQTEQTYSGTSFTLAGGDAYDDIRVYPKDSELTTYTYDPLIGMTSSTDAKGQTTYYEYDSFQRLMNIRDKDGNLLKHNDYHYQNQ